MPINTRWKFMTLALSYQYVHKNSVACFHFEQLSMIPVVSLLLTFNKYTASGVFFFSTFLCFKILSVGVNTSVHQDIWEETNKKRALESFFFIFYYFFLLFDLMENIFCSYTVSALQEKGEAQHKTNPLHNLLWMGLKDNKKSARRYF